MSWVIAYLCIGALMARATLRGTPGLERRSDRIIHAVVVLVAWLPMLIASRRYGDDE